MPIPLTKQRKSIVNLCWIGIDPGQNGGIAVLGANGSIRTTAMLNTERDIWDWIYAKAVSSTGVGHIALIEKVHSFPKQGVASSFKFGVGYGGLRMALIAANIPFEEVRPQVWQRALAIPQKKKTESKREWKNRLKGVAQQLFPKLEVTLKTADALLIAEYCRRKSEGLL